MEDDKLTNDSKCDMLLLDINHQKVLSVLDRRGNQVKDLNDPVTVSGSNI